MKKLITVALLGALFIGGHVAAYSQGEDSTDVTSETPNDTISLDSAEPVYYEEEPAAQEKSNTMTYALIGGIIVIGGAAFVYIKKKKKTDE